jgi:hypothetical protein
MVCFAASVSAPHTVRIPIAGRGECRACPAVSISYSYENWVPFARLAVIGVDGCEVVRFFVRPAIVGWPEPDSPPIPGTGRGERPLAGRPESLLFFAPGEALALVTGYGSLNLSLSVTAGPGAPRLLPPLRAYPLLFAERLGSRRRALRARLGRRVDGLVLAATGVNEENAPVLRTFVVRVDGREALRQPVRNRIFPDVYQVPRYVPWRGHAGEVEVECPDCGDDWIVSLWAYSLERPVGAAAAGVAAVAALTMQL